jgi:two-component system response regulator PilR (NtrC family)
MLHRALALSSADSIGVEELGVQPRPAPVAEALQVHLSSPAVELPDEVRASAASAVPPPHAVEELPASLQTYLDSVERAILEQALARHRFNRTAAGASLGLSLRQMRYRMSRLRIGVDSDTSDPI